MAAIASAAFAKYVEHIGRRPAPMTEDLASAVRNSSAVVAVAPAGGTAGRADALSVAGYATYSLGPRRADLTTVAVAPHLQGRGLGKLLIGAVELLARAAGASLLCLYTNAVMADNLTLYPHLGFAEVDARHEDGFSRVYFEKRLQPAVAQKSAVAGLYGRRKAQGRERSVGKDPLLLDLAFSADALFPPGKTLRLEVGFGGGEHLIDHARRAPDVALIGAEPFQTGFVRAIKTARAEGFTHIHFFEGDARLILEWLPEGRLDRVDVLYPDPWHKQKHWKRRFISSTGLDLLAHALRPRGTVRFASDIESYVRWTRAHVAAHPHFALTGDSAEPWQHWPGTRYERKALREGRTPRYLTLTRGG